MSHLVPPLPVHTELLNAVCLVQGWSSVIPHFEPIDFVSFYLEIPVMAVMYFSWILWHRPTTSSSSDQASSSGRNRWDWWFNDAVDLQTIDLSTDEFVDEQGSREQVDKKEGKGYLSMLYRWIV